MRLSRWIPLAVLIWSSPPSLAIGQTPSPANCSFPSFIDVVGTFGGIVDPAGTFTITIRDSSNNPIAGVPVTLDFGNCTDLRLSLKQAADATLSCDNSTLRVTSDALGQATFTVVGACSLSCLSGGGNTLPPGPGLGCIRICANSVLIGTMSAAVYDLDGAAAGDGLTAADLAHELAAVFRSAAGAPYRARYDYNHNGAINGLDASILAQRLTTALNGGGSRGGSGGLGYCTAPGTSFTCP